MKLLEYRQSSEQDEKLCFALIHVVEQIAALSAFEDIQKKATVT